uniref:(northern house mosquito) hypothetical protein n=1 Tax=Culex pipiens TaxID=7175 RepID=A0A8D8C1H1_CULPI
MTHVQRNIFVVESPGSILVETGNRILAGTGSDSLVFRVDHGDRVELALRSLLAALLPLAGFGRCDPLRCGWRRNRRVQDLKLAVVVAGAPAIAEDLLPDQFAILGQLLSLFPPP